MSDFSIRYSSVDRTKLLRERQRNPFKLSGSIALENNLRYSVEKYLDTPSCQINKLKPIIKPKKLPAIISRKELSNFENILFKTSDNSIETNKNDFSDVSSINKFISNFENKSNKHRIIVSGMTNALTNNTESSDINLNDFTTEKSINNIIRLKPIIKNSPSPYIKKINVNKNIYTINNNENIKNNYRHFNVYKTIKDIKKNISNQKIYENNLAYDKKFENVVFDAGKLLNKYRKKNSSALQNNNDVSSFLEQNKEISVKNLMIKLLNKQNDNLLNKHIERGKNIESYKNIIENDENNFENFSTVQKASYIKISDSLNLIQKKNIFLLEQEYKMQATTKIIEDEIFKLIEQIDLLRIYAKFIHRVLWGDPSFFDYEIIPEYKDDALPNLNYIINNIFDIYKKFLIGNMDIKNVEEYSFLNDPQIMLRKFKEMEDKIMRNLQKDEYYLEEVRKIKREKEEILSEMEKRKSKIEEEYEEILKEYNNYKANMFKEDDLNIGGISNKDYIDAAFELCNFIEENFGGIKPNKKGNDFQNFYVMDELKISKDIVEKKEAYLNNFFAKLENYEKESPKLFQKIINRRKIEIKILNQEATKQNIEETEKRKKYEADKRMRKIIFKKRRMATPPNLSKKPKIKITGSKTDQRRTDEEYLYY